jgi:hypothetical protein
MDLISFILSLALGGLIAWFIARAAGKQGFSFAKYFWVSFLLGIVGWIICAIMWQVDKSKAGRRPGSGTGIRSEAPNLRPDVGRPSYGPIIDKES